MRTLVFLACLCFPAAVFAQVPRHERVTVSAIKGGFKMKMVLQTTDSSRFPKAHVGFVDPKVTATLGRRDAAMPENGKLLHQLEAVSGVVVNQPHELEVKVLYGKGNSLTPGQRIHVVSAWPVDGTKYEENNIHVFGAVLGKQTEADEIELPK